MDALRESGLPAAHRGFGGAELGGDVGEPVGPGLLRAEMGAEAGEADRHRVAAHPDHPGFGQGSERVARQIGIRGHLVGCRSGALRGRGHRGAVAFRETGGCLCRPGRLAAHKGSEGSLQRGLLAAGQRRWRRGSWPFAAR
nr:hypothetical protein [Mangrovicoccus ximenensis]